MPRAGREFFDGATYHVYNRLARGERAFADESIADSFADLLQKVMARDGVRVFAWALLPNHFHLAVQAGAVAIGRPMKSLQQGMTRQVNIRQRVFGPLWQGRYKAKLVRDQRYLDQLLAYIHLNPVSGGLRTLRSTDGAGTGRLSAGSDLESLPLMKYSGYSDRTGGPPEGPTPEPSGGVPPFS